MQVLSFINVSWAYVSHRATLWQEELRAGPTTVCPQPPAFFCFCGTVFRNPDNSLCFPAGDSLCSSTSWHLYRLQIDSVLGGGWGGLWMERDGFSSRFYKICPGILVFSASCWVDHQDSFFVCLFFCSSAGFFFIYKGKYFGFITLNLSSPIWSMVANCLVAKIPAGMRRQLVSGLCLCSYSQKTLSKHLMSLSPTTFACIPSWSWLVIFLQKERELASNASDQITSQSFVA